MQFSLIGLDTRVRRCVLIEEVGGLYGGMIEINSVDVMQYDQLIF